MLLVVAALAIVPIPPEARRDADCVEATSWALSWMGSRPHDEAIENVRYVNYYYMGRLTARNDDIDWAMSLSRDMNENPRPSEQVSSDRLSECADQMAGRILTPIVQRALSHLPPDRPSD
jgi:hypothetical protein